MSLDATELDFARRLYTAELAAFALADALANLGNDTAPEQDSDIARCRELGLRFGDGWRALTDGVGLTGLAGLDLVAGIREP